MLWLTFLFGISFHVCTELRNSNLLCDISNLFHNGYNNTHHLKFTVLCHLASKIGDFKNFELTTEKCQSHFINGFVRKHNHALKLVATANNTFKFINLGQLFTALGMLFYYCFIGEVMLNMSDALSQFLYCSQWYALKSIATKKKVLIILMITQREKGYSAVNEIRSVTS
ncbi:CLUMA_CG015614, isoform A [Clunio marinus]|uniref:CLUMA_CG015614, isoform A n=1 Tax=Clunio marinus TaxID=568069 RepID=A0A1J1IU70_9DIPT|nr:CLUMA_CG015614, isoform A [Clunio marinus]